MLKSNRGITLIVLVITIILLLILSTITIEVVGNKLLIKESKNIVENAENNINKDKEEESNAIDNWFTSPGQSIQSGTNTNRGN